MANQKGGVGKTATTLGLASAITYAGGRVLIVDMDPQGNSTGGVGVEVGEEQPTVTDLFDRNAAPGAAADVVVASAWDGVDIAPATRELANVEEAGDADLVWRLDTAFEGLDLSAYDAVLFDCPPSLGRLLFSALVAADAAVVVTEATKDSVKGVTEVEETIERVRRRPNKRLQLGAIVVSRRRNVAEHNYRESELRTAYGTLGDGNRGLVARTVIPDLAARQDAHSESKPMHLFRGGKALALQVAYTDLAKELGLLPNGASA
ncbi:ParA family protein [Nocardia otitidiscaviarum]|uniref:ParA family protein n=1 Tax=Nocardia otitidiscaviarum TaxID=1823 RepID=UPI00189393B0|nr:ParA family protein [Nocardia otitidiscaviarum]MBF6138253.1 ParA family protein [Nocardia otitidiscaviarum]